MVGRYLNLTPHDVTLVIDEANETRLTIGASGYEMRLHALPFEPVASERVETQRDFVWLTLVVPRVYDGLEYDRDALLPEFSEPDLTIIVSELVGSFLKKEPGYAAEFRHCRVVSPDTNPDSAGRVDGQIVGVRRFIHWNPEIQT